MVIQCAHWLFSVPIGCSMSPVVIQFPQWSSSVPIGYPVAQVDSHPVSPVVIQWPQCSSSVPVGYPVSLCSRTLEDHGMPALPCTSFIYLLIDNDKTNVLLLTLLPAYKSPDVPCPPRYPSVVTQPGLTVQHV